ncbi:hypothetical protein INT47_010521 [Mucor saturninus]|uniref:Uncharacterized protein n=1 Tax=Mucor saturninus TaxID=64648 RepID=A0A8H7RBZ9_9FUNG|nr:hypothetical protein INT47_010521 [Mucor saturninus]
MTGSIKNVYKWVNQHSSHIKIKAARELGLMNSKVKTKFCWLDDQTPVQNHSSSNHESKSNNKQNLTNAIINSSSIKVGNCKDFSQPRTQHLTELQEHSVYAANKPVSEEDIDADVDNREGTKNNNINTKPAITAASTNEHAATPGKQIAAVKNSTRNHFTTVNKHATTTTSMHTNTMVKHASNTNSFHVTTMNKYATNTTHYRVTTMNKHTASTPNASSHGNTSSKHETNTSKSNTITDAVLKITAVPFQATKAIPSDWIISNVSPDKKPSVNDRKRSLVETNSPIVGTEFIDERDPIRKKIRLANPKKAVDLPIEISCVIPHKDPHDFKIKENIRMANQKKALDLPSSKINESIRMENPNKALDLPIQISNVIPRRDPHGYKIKRRYNLMITPDY